MGWGQIIGGGEDGLYTVALDYGVATRDAWVAAIDGWIERMNVEIADAEAKLVAARDRTAAAEAELQALIGLLSSGGGPDGSAATMARIDIATARYAQALAAQDAIRIPRDQRIAERKALVAKKNLVEAAVVQQTRQAWCVDYTQDATGYVATIEVPGEDQAILIAPGAREPTAADGALAARELMTPWQAFWNAAVLPGWQKWKPTYRKGTLTAVDQDANLASVSLDPATSSAQGLPVNQSSSLSGVPVVYMDCHAEAFEVGDRVIIEFEGQDWKSPRVIGFVDHPKPCVTISVEYYVNGDLVYSGSFYDGDTVPGWSAPASVDGSNGSETVARPFAGWDDGEVSASHPEFVAELPKTPYVIRANYPAVGSNHNWALEETFKPPNSYYPVYHPVTGVITHYMASSKFGSAIRETLLFHYPGEPASPIGFWSITLPDFVGPEEQVPSGQDPGTFMMGRLPGAYDISAYVPSSYSQSSTNENGWTITQTLTAVFAARTEKSLRVTSITATPP